MSSSIEQTFKQPPVTECIAGEHCLSFGKKIYVPDKICHECLSGQNPGQLREWADDNPDALAIIELDIKNKQKTKENLEAHSRYLCAFEDPDYQHCRWRKEDLDLRDRRTVCLLVRRKGMACQKCWRHHLKKIELVQYFTPTGLCHEEAFKPSSEAESSDSRVGDNDDEDDVEGYNVIL
ncbi:hypothetical protein CC78DRAFT_534226 [Lojkania enalia]|uniref:Uncharacterized protein n=1 Tax=Lojkania enalia TaxID=147567 RepID=A0A9P4K5F6_9PLEO|nr:hypothetical protein CC78DRAFT_534226 [Didymosphaeria enalia]